MNPFQTSNASSGAIARHGRLATLAALAAWTALAVALPARALADPASPPAASASTSPPPSAPVQPPPATAFAETSDFSFLALSPDGQHLALDLPADDGPVVVVQRIGQRAALRTVRIGREWVLRGLSWADDRTVLLDVSGTVTIKGGPTGPVSYEFLRTMAVNTDGGPPRMLLMDDLERKWVTGAQLISRAHARPNTVSMATWDFTITSQRDSVGTRLHDERRDSGWEHTLFDVDTATGRGRLVDRGTAYTRTWLVDAEGQPVARSEWQPEPRDLSILARDARGWREVHRQRDTDDLTVLAGTTADGKALVMLGENGTDRVRAWAIARDGSGTSLLFEDPSADLDAALTDAWSGAVVGYQIGGLAPRQHWTDPARDAQQRALAKAFPGREVQVTDRSRNGKQVLVLVESPQHPPVHYLVDFERKAADIVGEAYPGTPIPAYLTLPPGATPRGLPLVVLPHGGPEDRDLGGFDWWAQFLATRGYAVLQPQFRGSTGFGREHRLAGYRQWGGRMQDDVSDGVRHLVATGVADPNRVCIVGASYGGYAALAGAAFTPELYRCAVSVNGVSDLPSMLADVARVSGRTSNRLAYWKDHIGVASDPDVAGRSPARAAAAVRAPVLLLHGTDDTVVLPAQSQKMAAALAAAGKPHRLTLLPGEDHWLSNGATRTRVLEEIERFLGEHLGGGGAKAPPTQAATHTAAP